MKVVLFGATGMVGQGVLRECLLHSGVERVLAVGRTATPQQHEKLRNLLVGDFSDFSGAATELSGYDACFFCLGITSAWINVAYAVLGPLYPVWKRLAPRYVTTTEQIGRAMIAVARRGAPKHVLENDDINRL